MYCPKGSPIRYGVVVGPRRRFRRGRERLPRDAADDAVVAFEEPAEEVEGHYFYVNGEEFRVLRLDSVILAFPRE